MQLIGNLNIFIWPGQTRVKISMAFYFICAVVAFVHLQCAVASNWNQLNENGKTNGQDKGTRERNKKNYKYNTELIHVIAFAAYSLARLRNTPTRERARRATENSTGHLTDTKKMNITCVCYNFIMYIKIALILLCTFNIPMHTCPVRTVLAAHKNSFPFFLCANTLICAIIRSLTHTHIYKLAHSSSRLRALILIAVAVVVIFFYSFNRISNRFSTIKMMYRLVYLFNVFIDLLFLNHL